MTVNQIRGWIKQGTIYKFYKTKEWTELRDTILKENHYECKWCKDKGRISKAETVHHVQYVKSHPELALSRTYIHNGREYDNLIPLCHECHDKAHERMKYKPRPKPLTEERW